MTETNPILFRVFYFIIIILKDSLINIKIIINIIIIITSNNFILIYSRYRVVKHI